MDIAPREMAAEGGSGDLDARADAMLSEFVARMRVAGWQSRQSLDAVEGAASRLRDSHAQDSDRPGDGRPSRAGDALDEPSNDWPAE